MKYMGYVFKRSRTYANRFYCVQIETTIANHRPQSKRPWIAYRRGEVSGATDIFRGDRGMIRTFSSAEACMKAVVEKWAL